MYTRRGPGQLKGMKMIAFSQVSEALLALFFIIFFLSSLMSQLILQFVRL